MIRNLFLRIFLKVSQGIQVEELPLEAREMLKAVRGDSIFLKLDTVWKDLQQHIGCFQLLVLIITELKSHMTCYNSMPLIG